LRERGGEYGSTTGRPRRCGWLDLVALKHAVRLNGLDGIILTKLDVLDAFEEIKVCVAYQLEDRIIENFPASLTLLERSKPVYKSFEGWKESTYGAVDRREIPKKAWDYIKFIQEYLGVPVVMLSTSPEKDKYLWLKEESYEGANIG
jgi:adenylosuccinate synthase